MSDKQISKNVPDYRKVDTLLRLERETLSKKLRKSVKTINVQGAPNWGSDGEWIGDK